MSWDGGMARLFATLVSRNFQVKQCGIPYIWPFLVSPQSWKVVLGQNHFLVYLCVFFREVREKDFTRKSVVSLKAFKALCHVDPCAFWSKRSVWMFTFTRYRAIITDSGFTAKRLFTIDWGEKFSPLRGSRSFFFSGWLKPIIFLKWASLFWMNPWLQIDTSAWEHRIFNLKIQLPFREPVVDTSVKDKKRTIKTERRNYYDLTEFTYTRFRNSINYRARSENSTEDSSCG